MSTEPSVETKIPTTDQNWELGVDIYKSTQELTKMWAKKTSQLIDQGWEAGYKTGLENGRAEVATQQAQMRERIAEIAEMGWFLENKEDKPVNCNRYVKFDDVLNILEEE
jgi:hypothetical protein